MGKTFKLLLTIFVITFLVSCGSGALVREVETAMIKTESTKTLSFDLIDKTIIMDKISEYNKSYDIDLENKIATYNYSNTQSKGYFYKHCKSIKDDEFFLTTWDDFLMGEKISFLLSNSYIFSLKKISVSKEVKGEENIYQITVPKKQISNFVKLFQSEVEIPFEMFELIVTTNKDGLLKKYEVIFGHNYNGAMYKQELTFEIKALGDDVQIDIPDDLMERMLEFYDQEIYSGPRSYLYNRDNETANEDDVDLKLMNYKGNVEFFDVTTKSYITKSDGIIRVYSTLTNDIIYQVRESKYAYVFGNGVVLDITKNEGNNYSLTAYKLISRDFLNFNIIDDMELNLNDPCFLLDRTFIFDASTELGNKTVVLNLESGKITYLEENIGRTNRVVKRNLQLMYAEDSSNVNVNGTSTLQLVNIVTGKVLKTITASNINPEETSGLSIIGNGLLFYNKIYDVTTGEILSNTSLRRDYPKLDNFIPKKTIYFDDNYDIVVGDSDDGKAYAIFNNKVKRFVYLGVGNLDKVEFYNNVFYLLFDNGYATLDPKKLPVPNESIEDLIKVTINNNITKVNFNLNYSDIQIKDDNLIVSIENVLYIFSLVNFELINEITLENKVYRMDLDNNIIAISYGKKVNKISYIDLSNFDVINIQTDFGITDIQIYNNCIYYGEYNLNGHIYCYDLLSKNTTRLNFTKNYPFFVINKETGIIYATDYGTDSRLSCFDIKENKVIYTSLFVYSRKNVYPITFDGKYIHTFGLMIDATTMNRLTVDEYSKIFPFLFGYNLLGSIYYDGSTSVVISERNGTMYTVIFDIIANKVLFLEGDAERIVKLDDKFVVIGSNRNVMHIVSK